MGNVNAINYIILIYITELRLCPYFLVLFTVAKNSVLHFAELHLTFLKSLFSTKVSENDFQTIQLWHKDVTSDYSQQ